MGASYAYKRGTAPHSGSQSSQISGASVGASPELIQMADKIIIEVNTAMPSFEGLHDITMTDLPPRRKPYLIMSPED